MHVFKYVNGIFKLKVQYESLKVWVGFDALYFFFPWLLKFNTFQAEAGMICGFIYM